MSKGAYFTLCDTHDEWSFWDPSGIFLVLKYGLGHDGGLGSLGRVPNMTDQKRGRVCPFRSLNYVF